MRPGWGPIWVTSGTKIDGSRASEGAQRATGYQYHQNTSRNFISEPVSAVRGIPGGIAAEIHENLARMADFAPKWQILEIPSSNIPGPHCSWFSLVELTTQFQEKARSFGSVQLAS